LVCRSAALAPAIKVLCKIGNNRRCLSCASTASAKFSFSLDRLAAQNSDGRWVPHFTCRTITQQRAYFSSNPAVVQGCLASKNSSRDICELRMVRCGGCNLLLCPTLRQSAWTHRSGARKLGRESAIRGNASAVGSPRMYLAMTPNFDGRVNLRKFMPLLGVWDSCRD